MKWKRDSYPKDGTSFEAIMKGKDGKRKTFAKVYENSIMVKGTGGQYWRNWNESLVAWRFIREVEISSIDDVKKDVEDIKHIMENYANVSQVFDNGFNDVVNEVGTYDALHAMRVSSRAVPTSISPYVVRIFEKYESIIESRRWGLLDLYQYLNERVENC